MNTEEVKKAYRKVDSLIKKAKQYRDKYGYRENLGYDQDTKLSDYLNKTDLTYAQRAEVIAYFFNQCDLI